MITRYRNVSAFQSGQMCLLLRGKEPICATGRLLHPVFDGCVLENSGFCPVAGACAGMQHIRQVEWDGHLLVHLGKHIQRRNRTQP